MKSATAIVIGYGNELRGDDAIGQKIARNLKTQCLSLVKSVAVHQLTPELSELLATAKLAIFVDACVNFTSNKVQVKSLLPSDAKPFNGHIFNPESLLYLAEYLYGNCPKAWLITVPGVNFELSDQISPIAQKGITTALSKIMQILDQNKNLLINSE